MAQKIVAGNWKMNLDQSEAINLANGVNDATQMLPTRQFPI